MSHLVVLTDSYLPDEAEEQFKETMRSLTKELLVYETGPFAFLDVFQAVGQRVCQVYSNYAVNNGNLRRTGAGLVKALEENLIWTEEVQGNFGLGISLSLCRFAHTGGLNCHILIMAGAQPLNSSLLLSSVFQAARTAVKIHAAVHRSELVTAYLPITSQTGGSALTTAKGNPSLKLLNLIFNEPFQRPMEAAQLNQRGKQSQRYGASGDRNASRVCEVCQQKVGSQFRLCSRCFTMLCSSCNCRCSQIVQ